MKKFLKTLILLLFVLSFIFIVLVSCVTYNIQFDFNSNIPEQLTEPESKELKVLVIEINPKLNTKNNIKASEFLNAKGDEKNIITEVLADLEYSSWGYVKPKVVKTEYLNEFPTYTEKVNLVNGKKALKFDEETWLNIMAKGYKNFALTSNKYGDLVKDKYKFDYNYIMNKFNLVNRRNANEFDWVFISAIEPTSAYESVMVGSNSYWINGPAYTANCSNFPIIYANISRKDGILHSVGHMSENIINFTYNGIHNIYSANSQSIKSKSDYEALNTWDKYKLSKQRATTDSIDLYGVGTVHFPANASKGYDTSNTTYVNSNWKDWRYNYPNLKGTWEKTNSSAWLSEAPTSGNQSSDRKYQRWWFKNMPHVSGRSQDGYYHNWWKYITTLDYVETITTKNSDISFMLGNNSTKLSYTLKYHSGKKEVVNSNEDIQIKNTSILEVTKDGLLKGKKAGKTSIDVYRDGKKITFNVTITKPKITQLETLYPEVTQTEIVEPEVTGLSLDKSSGEIEIGKQLKLTATVTPNNAKNKKVSYKSNNTSVATVDANGNVKGIKAGKAIITATAGGKSAICTVTVKATTKSITTISLDSTSIKLEPTKKYTLKATITTSNTSNKSISYKSSNTKVATVDSNGVVTAKALGKAKITATFDSKKAQCEVTVLIPRVKNFSFDTNSLTHNSVKLKWSKNSYASKYKVYMNEKNVDGSYTKIDEIDVNKLTYTIKNLSPNKTYYFKILAVKNGYEHSTAAKLAVTTKLNIANATVAAISNQKYTGKAIQPKVTIKNGQTTLISGTDYTLSYSNNKKVGTATITITGKGNYSGSKKVKFKIVK